MTVDRPSMRLHKWIGSTKTWILLLVAAVVLMRTTVILAAGSHVPLTFKRPLLGGYRWSSSLDRTTGVASSRESSNVPKSSRLFTLVNQTEDDSALLGLTQDLVQRYPTWVCTFPITLGLLKAVTPVHRRGIEIRTRLWDINLLTFGPIQGHRLTYRENPQLQTCHCTVVLPIVGGLLALSNPSRGKNEQSSNNNSNGNQYRRGSLLVSLKKNRHILESKSNDDAANHVERFDKDCTCSLSSAIVGYRPWLAGQAPVSLWRMWTYRSTQSIVHAHIMWRFHRFLWKAQTSL